MIQKNIRRKIIYGTAQFGNNYSYKKIKSINQKKVNQILTYLVKKNVNKIDTAESYGDSHYKIGKFNKKKNNRFEIFTKITVDNFFFNKKFIEKKINLFCKSLNKKKINILIHNPTTKQIKSKLMRKILIYLERNNMVKLVGISVDTPTEFFLALKLKEIKIIQFPFNIIDKRWDIKKIIKNKKNKILIARSIFLQGLLLDPKNNQFPKFIKKKISLININLKKIDTKNNVLKILLSFIIVNKWIDYFILAAENLDQLKKSLNINNFVNIDKKLLNKINSEIGIKDENILRPYNWKKK